MNCLKKFSVALLALVTTGQLFAAVTIGQLRSEHLQNPQGIDAALPRLGWQLASGERGVQQAAYQILVASTEKNLAHDRGDLWDGGKISSGESILIPYAGKNLASWQQCFWKVRVWDASGKVSAWSETASWTMGILNSSE